MEHYPLLKMLHSIPAILLLVGILVHIFMLWKAARGGDAAVLTRKLQRTRSISLPVLAVFALSLPLTGWWMVSLAGLPLSQTWLLVSSLLFVVLVPLTLLLAGRLAAWQAAGASVAASVPRLSAVYAGLIVLLVLVIMGLMGAKPA
ncbi:MAG: DUF2269 domain-containing protein [Gammaproteobacteria bacterium]|nr:DUF2269 domain-containing protein [Gammaproteobacteria bacterium]MBU1491513.1 DUF2269 domain-containing protein [Gammaproteobacteria bacterium]MBU2064557.1 DUF2269 domain-containing protein [Gammaproteobacteria bacterium]MBU2140040.1 DUF2269 domain-containing protein [Gammaproteobacteria bacterium]MBU2216795.1 DUF2269 domain-containing protein [Gammaproteobacteria bacterium]